MVGFATLLVVLNELSCGFSPTAEWPIVEEIAEREGTPLGSTEGATDDAEANDVVVDDDDWDDEDDDNDDDATGHNDEDDVTMHNDEDDVVGHNGDEDEDGVLGHNEEDDDVAGHSEEDDADEDDAAAAAVAEDDARDRAAREDDKEWAEVESVDEVDMVIQVDGRELCCALECWLWLTSLRLWWFFQWSLWSGHRTVLKGGWFFQRRNCDSFDQALSRRLLYPPFF
jgi:hypothetical protein